MKRVKIEIGIILILLTAGSINLAAQHGMRGMRDSLRTRKPDTASINRMHRGPMSERYGMYDMRHMWHEPMWRNPEWPGPRGRWEEPFWPGPVRRGVYPLPPAHFHRFADSTYVEMMDRYRMERRDNLLENIPGLSESQKSKLKDLMEKNQAEMKKFREESAARMKSMRDTHRKEIIDMLTPEQKKWYESRVPVPDK